jgi:phytoene dehydrogenase-like protein
MSKKLFDVAIVGGGISGISTALRLQSNKLKTVIFESDKKLGGCAGYFERNGFYFDVGTTAFVDFEETGLGGKFLKDVGIPAIEGNILHGYKMHLPDTELNLYKDQSLFIKERERVFGKSKNLDDFWNLLDELYNVFWEASRKGIKLPIQSITEIKNNIDILGKNNLYLTKYIYWTVDDALTKFKLWENKPLVGMLRCLVEDTLQCNDLSKAPLINASLGITIRVAGLLRPNKGSKGIFDALEKRYLELGGEIFVQTKITKVDKQNNVFTLDSQNHQFYSKIFLSAIPITNTKKLFEKSSLNDKINSNKKLSKFIEKNKKKIGGGVVMFLGVPEEELIREEKIDNHNIDFTYHQLLIDYDKKLGNGKFQKI